MARYTVLSTTSKKVKVGDSLDTRSVATLGAEDDMVAEEPEPKLPKTNKKTSVKKKPSRWGSR